MQLSENEKALDVAIVGGGIVGLVLGIGLIKRGVDVTIYEQARGFKEIGAGIAFTANAVRCMELIDEDVIRALRAGGANATSSSATDSNDGEDDAKVHDFLRWVDGYNVTKHLLNDSSVNDRQNLHQIDAGYRGFEGTRRDTFLEQLAKYLPSGIVQFRKRLCDFQEMENGRALLSFIDGSTAEADAVIGCDGIKSKVRELMFGSDNPASFPHYSHRVAYRGLVGMSDAVQALGEYRARNQHMHVGPNAHIVHYPVANSTMVNVAAFVYDEGEFNDADAAVMSATRSEVEDAFKAWGKPIRDLVACYPRELSKWALFDLWDFPLDRYNHGLVCLVGDAAHAAVPHHGAGAGMGIEDVLCLCALIEEVKINVDTNTGIANKGPLLKAAFQILSTARKARTQWLVDSSRRVCDLYQQPGWADTERYEEATECFQEIEERTLRIWKFDHEAMVADARNDLKAKIGALQVVKRALLS